MAQNKHKIEVPTTEDFMREHGMLNRILLIYEAIIQRITRHENFPILALQKSVDIIQFFIEGHHERMEEDYIFPLFEKHKKELPLIEHSKNNISKGVKLPHNLKS